MGLLTCFTRAKSFHVKIILLDKQELIQEIQEKTTGQDLLDNIFKYLNLIETAYFGLRYQDSANQTVSKFEGGIHSCDFNSVCSFKMRFYEGKMEQDLFTVAISKSFIVSKQFYGATTAQNLFTVVLKKLPSI